MLLNSLNHLFLVVSVQVKAILLPFANLATLSSDFDETYLQENSKHSLEGEYYGAGDY